MADGAIVILQTVYLYYYTSSLQNRKDYLDIIYRETESESSSVVCPQLVTGRGLTPEPFF